jgi:dicarboxylate transporter 10
MQAEHTKPPHAQFRYSNVIHGLWSMMRQEGPRSWFRGLDLTIFRAILTNVGQLAVYACGTFSHLT